MRPAYENPRDFVRRYALRRKQVSRTHPSPKRPPRPLPVPRDPFAPWSADLLRQEALRRVSDIFDPQEASIRRTAEGDVGAIRGAGEAAAALLRQSAPATQAAYQQAGQAVSGYAGGFTGAMADQVRAQQAQDAAFVESQGGTATHGTDANALHDTLYALEGYNPASGLAAQGAAARAYAEQLPGIEGVRAAEDVRGRIEEQRRDLSELAAKRPELYDQIVQSLREYEVSKLNARLSRRQQKVQERAQALYERQFGETARAHRANEALDQMSAEERARHNREIEAATKARNQIAQNANKLRAESNRLRQEGLELRDRKQRADLAYRRQQGRKPDPALSRQYGHIVDSHGKPIRDSKGRVIKVRSGSGGGGGGNLPPSAR